MSAFSFISPAELQEKLKSLDITLIDTRPSSEFSIGFVPGSLGIGPDGRYDSWAATYTEGSTHINLITPLGEEASTVERLRKAGVRNISAVLEGGFEAWQNIGAPVLATNTTAQHFDPTATNGMRYYRTQVLP